MYIFRIVRALTILILSIVLAELLMYLGYLIYIPQFGSYIDSYYILTMRLQFLLVSIACSTLVFVSGRFLSQSLMTSSIILVLFGGLFAWYRPEIGQYHWIKSLYEFHAIYFIVGVLVVIITIVLGKRRLKENI